MPLPEIGGCIQMAYDKVKQRHFIYYNQVIKPALETKGHTPEQLEHTITATDGRWE